MQDERATLRLVSKRYHFSRSHIYLNDEEGRLLKNLLQWNDVDISMEGHSISNIHLLLQQEIKKALTATGKYIVEDMSVFAENPEYSQVFSETNIHALYLYALKNKGDILGFMGFESCTTGFCLSASQSESLESICRIVGIFLRKDTLLSSDESPFLDNQE